MPSAASHAGACAAPGWRTLGRARSAGQNSLLVHGRTDFADYAGHLAHFMQGYFLPTVHLLAEQGCLGLDNDMTLVIPPQKVPTEPGGWYNDIAPAWFGVLTKGKVKVVDSMDDVQRSPTMIELDLSVFNEDEDKYWEGKPFSKRPCQTMAQLQAFVQKR